jgi:hypothetical protein
VLLLLLLLLRPLLGRLAAVATCAGVGWAGESKVVLAAVGWIHFVRGGSTLLCFLAGCVACVCAETDACELVVWLLVGEWVWVRCQACEKGRNDGS